MKENQEKRQRNKGTTATTDNTISNEDSIISTSEESGWKSPSQLKQEVQTIIDIMGPPMSPNFNYNTSSDADNEESAYSNLRISTANETNCTDCNKPEPCECSESEKSLTIMEPLSSSKDDQNISTTAADLNTSVSPTLDDLTDPKVNFPYVDNFCNTSDLPQYTICPPPLMPANICVNSECFCPQVSSILHGKNIPPVFNGDFTYEAVQPNQRAVECTKSIKDKNVVFSWLRSIMSSKFENGCNKCNQSEYYKMNVKKNIDDDGSPPRRVVFELVDSKIKKPCEPCNDPMNIDVKKKKNAKNQRLQCRPKQCIQNVLVPQSRKSKKPVEKTLHCDSSGKTRVDVYYFDHGSYNHYQTTDAPPLVTTEEIADLTEKHTTRFWAELFGSIHIGFSFATSFILQLFRFILYSICRPLTIGLIQLASDYFFKPLLATVFNGILQPALIFIYNILATLRDICDPIAEGIGYFLRELAVLVQAFRFVEIRRECKCCNDSNKCDRKVKKERSMC
ncbi:unnamed protein product [Ceutorhynchus assimilis]|uniref:Uncharacterized protein n=1 Tax=Ceutorhynchus assimilis TaxID=467358 RepID=A0A9N9MPX5_9CUCU|nr:unnamed protein product [Ceutorhynchus assimilis]